MTGEKEMSFGEKLMAWLEDWLIAVVVTSWAMERGGLGETETSGNGQGET